MTQDEINRYAEEWAADHSGIANHTPLPQVLAQFGWELQKRILEPLSDDILAT
jgi:hypothetical protein